jgi:hypothetical protein
MPQSENSETQSVTWRLPTRVAEAHANDWSEFRKVLDEWAENGSELETPEAPEDTTSCCMRVDKGTLAELEKEAKRMTKKTGRRWTAGKVAREVYDIHLESE